MIKHNAWVNRPEYEAATLRVLRSGHVGPGPEVEAFERELAERFRPGGETCCVSSGTAALRLALRLLGEHNVSIPTYACSALWHAAYDGMFGPSLVDVDRASFNAPTATVVVHTYGVPSEVSEDGISDFTHAPGATIGGRSVGSLGAFSVVSFGATKPLGCGSGGAILGPADAIAEARAMRDYDRPGMGERFNYSWHDLGAAIGRERLRRLDEGNRRRIDIASLYSSATPWATRIHGVTKTNKGVSIPILGWGDSGKSWYWGNRVFYRYVVHVSDVSRARGHFAALDIETINPLRPDELLHRRLGMDPAAFPVAEDVAAHTLSLPIWPGMSESEVSRVCDALAEMPE